MRTGETSEEMEREEKSERGKRPAKETMAQMDGSFRVVIERDFIKDKSLGWKES